MIIYHSAKPGVAGQLEATGTALIGVPCIGLFFMVSGYLMPPNVKRNFFWGCGESRFASLTCGLL